MSSVFVFLSMCTCMLNVVYYNRTVYERTYEWTNTNRFANQGAIEQHTQPKCVRASRYCCCHFCVSFKCDMWLYSGKCVERHIYPIEEFWVSKKKEERCAVDWCGYIVTDRVKWVFALNASEFEYFQWTGKNLTFEGTTRGKKATINKEREKHKQTNKQTIRVRFHWIQP